jgi:signal transduction histidine kinase
MTLTASASAQVPGDRASFGIPRRPVVVATAAVAFAFGLVLLPGPNPQFGESLIAVAIAIAVVGLATLWNSAPGIARVGVAFAYIALVAVLTDGAGGTSSGFGGLFLLPLLWLAVVGNRRELAAGFAAVAVARIGPVKLVGSPEYPPAAWRTGVVLGAVAVIGCVTVQQLVRVARLRASELLERAAELEDAARRLEVQNEQLRELDAVKDGFVGLVSHELRTPLTSIIGFLEILRESDDPLTAEQRQFLSTIGRNVDRLATLVNELLFLVQVDAGRLELQLAETDVGRLLAEATETARPLAESKGIELLLEADAAGAVLCDPGRMAQLVDNLISNAVKFTHDGGRVAVRAAQQGDTVEISVSDTGIGIPADELSRLFGRFFRATSAVNEGIPRTGLGLAISQAIAEAHGSTITAESSPGQTTFRLRLLARGKTPAGGETHVHGRSV